MSTERPEEETVFISMRVEDNPDPTPGSTIAERKCGQCGKQVWVSPASQPLLETADRVLCQKCAPPEFLKLDQAEPPLPEQMVEIVEARLPQVVKELRKLARAYPWVPVEPPPARHYRGLGPGISVCFTLDVMLCFYTEHLSVAYKGREPDLETVNRITKAFFGKALSAPAVGQGTLGPMPQEGSMVSFTHRYAGATVLHFQKLVRRAG